MPIGRHVVAIVALAGSCVAPGFAQTSPTEVWVVNQGLEQVAVIDSATNLVTTFSVADPDGNGTADPPWGVAFSTVPGSAGSLAFLTQGRFVSVVTVAPPRTIVALHDVAAMLGVPTVELRGLIAAGPREFLDPPAGSVVRSYLHVAATLPTGEARAVILDQAKMLTGGSPFVTSVSLGSDATAVDVEVLGTPFGTWFQRAWYTVTRSLATHDELQAVLVVGERTILTGGANWSVRATETQVLGAGQGAPTFLQPGAPACGELPVLPGGPGATLTNLDLGFSCSFPATELVATSITGPGIFSYTAFAVDHSSRELLVVDPANCGVQPIGVGLNPTDVATLGLSQWRSAFVTNRASDSVTRLDDDGTVTTIPLDPGAQPISVGVNHTLKACTIKDLEVTILDADFDTFDDDIRLTWTALGTCNQFDVQCKCITDDDNCPCDCNCDCQLPIPEECICTGFCAEAFEGVPQNVLHGDPWDPIKNPWKMLGVVPTTSFTQFDQAEHVDSWVYKIEPVP